MTHQVFEISAFQSGLDNSVEPYLAPPDAFVNLKDGYVHRGVLRSRLGYRQWATGGEGGADTTLSRLAVTVTNENVGNSANAAEQTFTLSKNLISRESVTIDVNDSSHGALQIVITPGSADGSESFSGDVDTGATNTINWLTGLITVTFDVTLSGSDPILVDYRYFKDSPVMGIYEWIDSTNSKKLIAFDRVNAYKYNQSTNRFEDIAFNGVASILAFTGSNSEFFDGTTYPFKNGSDRFVFTNNKDPIFRYDGTDVNDFSSSGDYSAPSAGSLDKGLKVHFYGERLVVLRPTLGGTLYPQGAVWTRIRDSSGNGDKFSGAGSGLESASTSEWIMDSVQTQNDLFVFFQRSVWKFEITSDVFAPFRWVHVADLHGVDALFSAVNYLGTNEAIGRLGIIGTDGRQATRVDNKIPFFTRDEIDQDLFEYIYSGYDRENSQFWFTYPESDETVSNKILVQNYEETSWSVYDIPLSVLGRTSVGKELNWNQISGDTYFKWAQWNTTEERWKEVGIEKQEEKLLGGDHRGFVYRMNSGITDKAFEIRGATQASQCVLTLDYHNLKKDDTVVITDVAGMTELNSDLDDRATYYNVETVDTGGDADKVTINVDSTNFSAYTSGGIVSKVIEFEAETVEMNPLREKGLRIAVEIYRIMLEATDSAVKVDVYDDSYFAPYKSDISIATSDTDKSKVWKIIAANASAYFHRLKFKQNTVKDQCKINILQIKASAGNEIG